MSGDAYPKNIQKCLDSWKKYLPDYEVWVWNPQRFDLNSSVWVKEAYEKKKYAFCADYIRLYALYHYGGIYLDSDVEVLKSFDPLLKLPYFIGMESKQYFEAAVIGAEQGNDFIGHVMKHYDNRHFIKENGGIDIQIMPEVMMQNTEGKWRRNLIHDISEFVDDDSVINVFDYDWFSPIDSTGKRYVLRTTSNSYCIHHFASAWVDWKVKLLVWIFGYNSPTRDRIQKAGRKIINLLKGRK